MFAIKPSGVPYEELSPGKMVIVDFDGNTVKGKLRHHLIQKQHAILYKYWEKITVSHIRIRYMQLHGHNRSEIFRLRTTHADHNTIDIPCAAPMNDEMIQGDY